MTSRLTVLFHLTALLLLTIKSLGPLVTSYGQGGVGLWTDFAHPLTLAQLPASEIKQTFTFYQPGWFFGCWRPVTWPHLSVTDWVKQIALPKVDGPYPISWRSEWFKKTDSPLSKRELSCLMARETEHWFSEGSLSAFQTQPWILTLQIMNSSTLTITETNWKERKRGEQEERKKGRGGKGKGKKKEEYLLILFLWRILTYFFSPFS